MHEFESFVYLDVQKTGSKFISEFLRKFSKEKEVEFEKHAPVGDDYDSAKFYFISTRDPLDQYLSLYSFGCERRGELYGRLASRNLEGLYERTASGFNRWLEFVLDPQSAETLDAGYGKAGSGHISSLLGLQSYRFLNLALLRPNRSFNKCSTKNNIKEAYRSNKITQATIHYERFAEDFSALIRNQLRHAIIDLDEALNYIQTAKPLNSSKRIDRESGFQIFPDTRKLVEECEWLFYDRSVLL